MKADRKNGLTIKELQEKYQLSHGKALKLTKGVPTQLRHRRLLPIESEKKFISYCKTKSFDGEQKISYKQTIKHATMMYRTEMNLKDPKSLFRKEQLVTMMKAYPILNKYIEFENYESALKSPKKYFTGTKGVSKRRIMRSFAKRQAFIRRSKLDELILEDDRVINIDEITPTLHTTKIKQSMSIAISKSGTFFTPQAIISETNWKHKDEIKAKLGDKFIMVKTAEGAATEKSFKKHLSSVKQETISKGIEVSRSKPIFVYTDNIPGHSSSKKWANKRGICIFHGVKNTTCSTQPVDQMAKHLKELVNRSHDQWKKSNGTKVIDIVEFCGLLPDLIKKLFPLYAIKPSFTTTGLLTEPDNIDFTPCRQEHRSSDDSEVDNEEKWDAVGLSSQTETTIDDSCLQTSVAEMNQSFGSLIVTPQRQRTFSNQPSPFLRSAITSTPNMPGPSTFSPQMDKSTSINNQQTTPLRGYRQKQSSLKHRLSLTPRASTSKANQPNYSIESNLLDFSNELNVERVNQPDYSIESNLLDLPNELNVERVNQPDYSIESNLLDLPNQSELPIVERSIQHNSDDLFPFACNKCPRRYANVKSLNRHMKQSHNENVKVLKCQYCDYRTQENYRLKDHINRKHPDKVTAYALICKNCLHINGSTSNPGHVKFICLHCGEKN